MVPGGRERTVREEELQRQVEGDASQGPVVKAKKAPSGPSLDEWDGWQPDMPSIEDGVRSAWLAKERVMLTDGLKPHVIIDIQNFIWITPTWAERQRTEHRQCWWASSRRIVG